MSRAGRVVALTHAVTAALAECELTYLARQPIDVDRAMRQHGAYCQALASLGCQVRTLEVSPAHADAVFVEDAVVVLDEVAIAGSMGAVSRRPEVKNLLPVIAAYRPIERVEFPATLEGGDVLRVGRRLYVGASPRTNAAGIARLRAVATPLGYQVIPVPVQGCLHLKTACTALDDDTLLVNPAWVDVSALQAPRILKVAAEEPFAANTLRLGGALLASASHPRTAELLGRAGFVVGLLDIAELEKAEAGLTCLSVLVAG